jgi:aminobenzoyl-glutamate utilization protein B
MVLLIAVGQAAGDEAVSKMKNDAVASIESKKSELIALSDQIWDFSETALKETRSAKLLADYAESAGFRVERGVAGLPTAFVATFGSGKPVIGIVGEYDALPGISQKTTPKKEARVEGAPGHGCGHNLFGTASLAAAIAIKEQMDAGRLKGTIRFYGCPAEETLVGKVRMARAGLFHDLDVCVAWHPGDKTAADTDGSRAMVDMLIDFRGQTAHASSNPWIGRSALDGAELCTHGINMLREHVKPSVRMHYVFSKAGDVPNVVPDRAQVWCWVRDSKRSGSKRSSRG